MCHQEEISKKNLPKQDSFEKFAKTVEGSESKVYCHYKKGLNRTGLMVAFYDITKNKKPIPETIVELIKKGFNPTKNDMLKKRLKDFISFFK